MCFTTIKKKERKQENQIRINLTMKVQDMDNENFKTLLGEIKNLNKLIGILYSQTGKLNVKMGISSKPIYRFEAINTKSPMNFGQKWKS